MALSQENLLKRCGRISASAFAKISNGGAERDREIKRIANERINGEVAYSAPNAAMQYGSDNEAKVFEMIQNEWGGIEQNDKFYIHDFESEDGITCKVGATPDGFYTKTKEPIEIKSPSTIENYNEQVEVASKMCDDFHGNFKQYRLAKYVKGYYLQLGYQVWVIRTAICQNYYINNPPVNHGTLIFSSPVTTGDDGEPHVEQAGFRMEFSEDFFKGIEETVVRAERDIQLLCNKESSVGEVLDDEEMTVELTVMRLADLKGYVNCIDTVAKKAKNEVDRRRNVLIEEVMPEVNELMAWLGENANEKHWSEGDMRVSGLSVNQSSTIEIKDHWDSVPREMLKVTLDKTAAKKYFKENGVLPPGTELKLGEPAMTVKASSMSKIQDKHMEIMTAGFIASELEGAE